jgi:hypothetical protein
MAPNDRFAAAQLIQSLADLKADNQSLGQSSFLALLPALSVSQLEDLTELFDMPWDKQNGAASPAAA